MEQVGYQIVHSIAGRIRIRVPWLETDAQSASNYQRLVEGLSGVKAVRINPLAQSIVVEYSARAISVSKMEELLISTMQQVKLTPPAAAPTVEQEPEPNPVEQEPKPNPEPFTVVEPPDTPPTVEPSETIVSEPPLETFVSPESTTNNVEPASSPHSESEQADIPEIPSPWDEEVTERIPEETSTIADPTSVLNCSTASLAKHLKVTSQAITRRRTKSDFGQWTKAQDPEGIAWNYDEHDRLFRPDSSTPSILE